MLKIYHNSRCRKSRAGLEYLRSRTADFEIIEYTKTGLNETQLREILLKLNKKPREVIRTQEEQFRQELKGLNLTEAEWIRIIIENPGLLQRPVIVGETRAVIGIPPEKIDILL